MAIDTIKLCLPSVEVASDANLTLNVGSVNLKTGSSNTSVLYTDVSGKEVYGAAAYLNTPNWNFDIRPLRSYVRFSAPKQVYENNYYDLREAELDESIERVEAELADNGIKADLKAGKLSRLDWCKNVEVSEAIETYAPLFSLLHARYTKDKTTYGVTGWLYKNKRTEFCIYDKLAELAENGYSTDGLPSTLRFEHRSKDARKVRDFYGFSTVAELKHRSFTELDEKEAKNWYANFFTTATVDGEVISGNGTIDNLRRFRELYGRKFYSNYCSYLGKLQLSKDTDVVLGALRDMGVNRMTLHRVEVDLRAVQLTDHAPLDVKMTDLYAELVGKVCGAVC